MKLPEKTYSVIYADPPWSYRDGRNPRGGADRHYSCMSMKDLGTLDVASLAAPDAFLFMWATMPLLPQAIDLMPKWGFTYKTCAFTWIKTTKSGGFAVGPGHYTRANAELCLLGIKGKPQRVSKSVRQVISAPRGRHSAKPPEVRDRIVTLCGDVPRIELFAREKTPGWDVWGNEV